MNFLTFLKTLENENNKAFLENVIKEAYNTLFEDIENLSLPDSPEETLALMEKKKKDIEQLTKLKLAQDEIIKNEKDLESKYPDFKETP